MDQLDAAERQGAIRRHGGEPSATGAFLTPTVLDHVTHDMDIAREETFGPVACVIRVRDTDEAIRLANDTPGLGAIVFGGPDTRPSASSSTPAWSASTAASA
ncbi:MAG: aldehyde dehydrogenase family protein [bacterium]